MIPDLRSRLKAVAERASAPVPRADCAVFRLEGPLPDGLEQVTARDARRLGLEAPAFDVRRALFLDTETTGLRGAGTVAFLVGMGWLEGDRFVVEQVLMRDYPEETSLLETVGARMAGFDSVVSFNGKSFDIPLLRDRFTMARLRPLWRELPQLDLLHAARRTWKERLENCALSTLEASVLGTPRTDDLPGALVPERYFQFLKCGDMALLEDVLRHNAQDIRSLAALLAHMARVYAQAEAQTSMLDVLSIGRALERFGEDEAARRCYRVVSVTALSERARLQLARSYRKARDWAASADVYRDMIDRQEGGVDAYVALAVLLEHYLGDVRGALQVTERALWRWSGADRFRVADGGTLDALERRRARLEKKLSRIRETTTNGRKG